jgi:membrane protease YdiL (CAAX protease family)
MRENITKSFSFIKKVVKSINPFNQNDNILTSLYIVKKILAFVSIYVIGVIIAEPIVIALHFAIGLNIFKGEMLSMQSMLLMKYYGYICMLVVCLVYCKKVERRSLKDIGFNSKFSSYFLGSFLGIIILGVSLGLIVLTKNMAFNGLATNLNFTIIFAFLGAFIVQGAMEETLCRGFLMTSLSKKVSNVAAIGISSLVFVYPHFSSLFINGVIYGVIGAINLILVSIIFSLLVISGKNIWIACGMHSFWNFCAFNVFGLNLSGTERSTAILSFTSSSKNIINGGAYGIESSIVTTLVLFICFGLLAFKYKRANVNKIEF